MRNIMLKGSNLSLNLENAGWRSSGGPFDDGMNVSNR